jgi:hypothetical protein
MKLIRLLLAGLAVLSVALSQRDTDSLLERFTRQSREAEARGLAEPFKGITANGTVETGLYSIKSTGVSTAPVRKAAEAFLASLTPEQRKITEYPVDDPEWRKWMNQHFYRRQGVSFDQLNDKQKEAGLGLLRASLSAKGMKLSRDIMKLNHTLGELNNNDFVQYGEWLYHLTIMGVPSPSEPWGWQIDGHHLIINYFVLGDQVVMSPVFVGSEPVIASSGKFKGTAILQEEQSKGLEMLLALDEAQRKLAVLRKTKTANDNVGEAFKDNVVLDYAGLPVSKMTPAQKKQLLALTSLYISNLVEPRAKIKMTEIEKHLDRTWFAWMGGTTSESVYYYRIHSPVVLIEFDHQRPAGLRHIKDPQVPNREHIHVVIRTPNGNDYGKDLLRQHYAKSKH